MEDNIELYERYIDGKLSAAEKQAFDSRLSTDREFATDFRIYLMTVRAICQEAQQDNAEFGAAIRHMSEEGLLRAIGRIPQIAAEKLAPLRAARRSPEQKGARKYDLEDTVSYSLSEEMLTGEYDYRESSDKKEPTPTEVTGITGISVGSTLSGHNRKRPRLRWWAAAVAVLLIGAFTVLHVRQVGMDRLDDTIVTYNYIAESDRGASETHASRGPKKITEDDIPTFEEAYRTAPADDIQAQEYAGLRLALAYLQVHDRDKAREVLTELTGRFADDEEFAAQCDMILEQLK